MPGQRPAGPPPPSRPRRPRRRRNTKLILLISLGVVAALAVTVGGIAFSVYDRATRIDRSTPKVVLFQYIQATFNDRDPRQVVLFTCGNDQGPQPIQDLLADLSRRDAKLSNKIEVDLAGVKTSVQGNTATVSAELRPHVIVNGSYQEDLQNWLFGLRQTNGGWRVCSARRLS